jgi:hypothetical protein
MMGLVLAVVSAAHATSAYDFSYSDPYGDVGSGTLSGLVDQGGGVFLVTAGDLNLTGSSDGNASVGSYSLLPAGPGQTIVEVGGGTNCQVDNLIYPAGNAPGVPSPSFLDNSGLIFENPDTKSQFGINIYNNNGEYDYGVFGGNWVLNHAGGTFTLTPASAPVPEPITFLTGLMVVSGIGAYVRRRTRIAKA